ncbi:Fur family transcriptional regulator [Tessaracoccus defluvii]|uniref:Fur family transcriptional regulator n=1 Tax=Tessaracoccus defluvii TaxID=1285901 RepID=UPI0031E1337F
MEQNWAEALHDAGLRVTAGRVAVLTELSERPHLGVGEITDAVRSRAGTASVQAVYDALAALHKAALIRRVEPAGQPPRYELQNGDNHHHLMCRSCGAMRDVACSIGHSPCLSPSQTHGFVIDEAEVIYWGLCAQCNEPDERTTT